MDVSECVRHGVEVGGARDEVVEPGDEERADATRPQHLRQYDAVELAAVDERDREKRGHCAGGERECARVSRAEREDGREALARDDGGPRREERDDQAAVAGSEQLLLGEPREAADCEAIADAGGERGEERVGALRDLGG
jgi:hypothetical protein